MTEHSKRVCDCCSEEMGYYTEDRGILLIVETNEWTNSSRTSVDICDGCYQNHAWDNLRIYANRGGVIEHIHSEHRGGLSAMNIWGDETLRNVIVGAASRMKEATEDANIICDYDEGILPDELVNKKRDIRSWSDD